MGSNCLDQFLLKAVRRSRATLSIHARNHRYTKIRQPEDSRVPWHCCGCLLGLAGAPARWDLVRCGWRRFWSREGSGAWGGAGVPQDWVWKSHLGSFREVGALGGPEHCITVGRLMGEKQPTGLEFIFFCPKWDCS